jgi:hypothetical protein
MKHADMKRTAILLTMLCAFFATLVFSRLVRAEDPAAPLRLGDQGLRRDR